MPNAWWKIATKVRLIFLYFFIIVLWAATKYSLIFFLAFFSLLLLKKESITRPRAHWFIPPYSLLFFFHNLNPARKMVFRKCWCFSGDTFLRSEMFFYDSGSLLKAPLVVTLSKTLLIFNSVYMINEKYEPNALEFKTSLSIKSLHFFVYMAF